MATLSFSPFFPPLEMVNATRQKKYKGRIDPCQIQPLFFIGEPTYTNCEPSINRKILTTAAVYIRKSREEAGKPSHRLTVQREQLPAHAKAQGWQVAIYDDGHASAARGKVEDLRARARLEADIRAGQIGVILCIELSRLSRDDSLQDYVAWLHLCAEHRVKLATPSRTLDPQQPSDWMLLLMEGGFSSVEMKILKRRMDEGRKQALTQGRYLSGNPPAPYRYDRAARGLVIDAAQLPVIQRVLSMSETNSTRDVASAVGWPLIKIRRIITDQRLIFYQGKLRHPDTGELIDGQWPAILTPEQAERIRAGRRHRKGSPKRDFGGLLSNLGLFVCGHCGRSVRSWKGREGQASFYGCKANETARLCPPSRMITQPSIDALVVSHLLATIRQLDKLQQAWHAAKDDNATATELRSARAKLEVFRQRKQRLIAAIAEGIIDFSDARQAREQIDREVADIVATIESLQTSIEEPDWESMAITDEEFWSLDTIDHRSLIKAAIESIALSSDTMAITYRFPLDSTGNRSEKIDLPPPGQPGKKRESQH